jgi:lysophospholipase L1-like esterase
MASTALATTKSAHPLSLRKKLVFAVLTICSLALLVEGGWRVIHGWRRHWLDCHRWHPVLGWSLREGWSGKWSWTGGFSRINEQGIRDDRSVGPKAPGEKRLLILGDSVTFGAMVSTEQAFPAQLQQRLRATGNSWRVLNGGVTSYDSAQEADWLDVFGLAMEPDAIAVAFCPNDVNASDRAAVDRSFGCEGASRWLAEHSIVCYNFQRGVQWLQVRLGLVSNPVLPPTEGLVGGWPEVETAYRQIANRARERGLPVILIIFPSRDELEGRVNTDVPAQLHALGRELGWHVIDLAPIFAEDPGALFLPNDPIHPNPEGYARVGSCLEREIRAHNLLP